MFSPDGFRPWIVNWEEVGGLLGARLRRQVAFSPVGSDLHDLLDRIESLGIPPEPIPTAAFELPLLIPIHLRRHPVDLSLVTAITTFGAPQDALVQQLRIETFFPADHETDRFIREEMTGAATDT